MSTADLAVTRLGDLLAVELLNVLIGLEILALAALVLFTRIDWRWLLAERGRSRVRPAGR